MLPADDEDEENRYCTDEGGDDLTDMKGVHAQKGGEECYDQPKEGHIDDIRIVVGGSSEEIEVFGQNDVLGDSVLAQTVNIVRQ